MEISLILDHLEFNILEDIDSMTAKDRVMMYANLKEFEQAKMQRATAAPLLHDDTDLEITIINSKEDLPTDEV